MPLALKASVEWLKSFKFLLFILFLVAQSVAGAQYAKIKGFYEPRTLVPNISYYGNADRANHWKKHGEVFDMFYGVNAYSNKRGGNGKYQCTEVVHRFLERIYGIPTKIGMGMGNANVLLQREKKKFGANTYSYKGVKVKMKLKANGTSKEPPAPASAINFKIGAAGHTAIVRYVKYVDSKTVRVYLFEQHGYPVLKPGQASPITSIKFTKSSQGFWKGETVKGTGVPYYWLNFEVQH